MHQFERIRFSKMATRLQPTVNMVIFARGKFRENVGKTFHVGVIFIIFNSYFLHKGIWVSFSLGDNFCKEDESIKYSGSIPRNARVACET